MLTQNYYAWQYGCQIQLKSIINCVCHLYEKEEKHIYEKSKNILPFLFYLLEAQKVRKLELCPVPPMGPSSSFFPDLLHFWKIQLCIKKQMP